MTHENTIDEPRWAGIRQVMGMSGPIILGSLSYTLMGFADTVMVARVDDEALAATGSAGLWAYTLTTLFLGVIGCVSTFVSQCIGRGRRQECAAYTWQGVYLSGLAGVLVVVLYPLAPPLFATMHHSPGVTAYETLYFRVRLLGFLPAAGMTALSAFFQGASRPRIPMYAAIAANLINLLFNYLLIFGHGGFPALGVAGAAAATVIAQAVQCALLMAIFLSASFNAAYGTRHAWRFDAKRARELGRIGYYSGIQMFTGIANWAIFTSYIVGRFGVTELAAHNVTISFLSVSFMPAVAMNQGIAPIVGEWIGRRDLRRAKARTYTALRITFVYMFFMGLIFIFFGDSLINFTFRGNTPSVVALGGRLLVLAGFFQALDAVNIVCAGALRGAGDTRWMMWMTLVANYLIFLPMATLFAVPLHGGAYGAWVAATLYIIGLSFFLFHRFHGEKWCHINIFAEEPRDSTGGGVMRRGI